MTVLAKRLTKTLGSDKIRGVNWRAFGRRFVDLEATINDRHC
jgi:hypothetical protein